jgi:hypothetical protein
VIDRRGIAAILVAGAGIAPAQVEGPELALLVKANGEGGIAQDHVEGGGRSRCAAGRNGGQGHEIDAFELEATGGGQVLVGRDHVAANGRSDQLESQGLEPQIDLRVHQGTGMNGQESNGSGLQYAC